MELPVLTSAGLFIWGILKRIYYWAPPFLLVLPAIWERYLRRFFPAPYRIDIVIPLWVFVVGMLIGVAVAAFRTYHELRMQKLGLEDRLKPKIEILSGDGPLFVRDVMVKDSPTVIRTCLIGLKNLSGVTSDDVGVDLVALNPDAGLYFPIPLYVPEWHLQLNPDSPKYIEVAKKATELSEQTPMITLCPQGGSNRDIPGGHYKLTVRAHGRNAPPVQETFILDVDDRGYLVFQLANIKSSLVPRHDPLPQRPSPE